MDEKFPRLEIYEDEHGEWRFRVVAENEEIVLAATQGYRDEHDALRGYRDAMGVVARIPVAAHHVPRDAG